MELKNSHGGYQGLSIIDKIQADVDKAFKQHIENASIEETYGFLCGVALALGRLRGSSYGEEIELASQRYIAHKEGVVS